MKKLFEDLVAEWTEELREKAIERAAIREYDGLQSRADAEQSAMEEIRRKVDEGKVWK